MQQAYNAVLDVQFSLEGLDPVTVTDVKNWLKIDLPDDDALIAFLISGARTQIENYVNLSLVNRTVKATIKNGLGNFLLPYGPVKAITTTTTLSGDAITITNQGNIINESFDGGNAVITYTAGFTTLPANLRVAWLQQCAYLYENRGDESAGDLSPIILTNLKAIRRLQ